MLSRSVLAPASDQVVVAPQVIGVRLQVLGRARRQRLPLGAGERQVQRAGHLLGDGGLHLEHVGELGVVALGPELAVVAHPDQLGRDADGAARALPAHAALEHVVHPQLPADLPHGLVGLAVLAGAGARDDAESLHPAQAAGDLLRQPAAEVLVLRPAEVLEREHREHQLTVAGGSPTSESSRGEHADARPPPVRPAPATPAGGGRAAATRARADAAPGSDARDSGPPASRAPAAPLRRTAAGRPAAWRGVASPARPAPAAIPARCSVTGAGSSARCAAITSRAESPGEGRLAGQQLVRDAAEGVEIHPVVHRIARGLLRRHVGGRAQHQPGGGEPGARVRPLGGGRERLGDAEVDDECVTFGEEDVAGLEVAVDDARADGRRPARPRSPAAAAPPRRAAARRRARGAAGATRPPRRAWCNRGDRRPRPRRGPARCGGAAGWRRCGSRAGTGRCPAPPRGRAPAPSPPPGGQAWSPPPRTRGSSRPRRARGPARSVRRARPGAGGGGRAGGRGRRAASRSRKPVALASAFSSDSISRRSSASSPQARSRKAARSSGGRDTADSNSSSTSRQRSCSHRVRILSPCRPSTAPGGARPAPFSTRASPSPVRRPAPPPPPRCSDPPNQRSSTSVALRGIQLGETAQGLVQLEHFDDLPPASRPRWRG